MYINEDFSLYKYEILDEFRSRRPVSLQTFYSKCYTSIVVRAEVGDFHRGAPLRFSKTVHG